MQWAALLAVSFVLLHAATAAVRAIEPRRLYVG